MDTLDRSDRRELPFFLRLLQFLFFLALKQAKILQVALRAILRHARLHSEQVLEVSTSRFSSDSGLWNWVVELAEDCLHSKDCLQLTETETETKIWTETWTLRLSDSFQLVVVHHHCLAVQG